MTLDYAIAALYVREVNYGAVSPYPAATSAHECARLRACGSPDT